MAINKFILISTLLFFLPSTVLGQDLNNRALLIIEAMIENSETSDDLNDLYEQVQFYIKHPVNINTADLDELYKIPCISPLKIQSISEHRILYGAVKNKYELQTIEGFTITDIDFLCLFVIFEPSMPSLKSIFKPESPSHTISVQTYRTLQKSEGYLYPNSNPNKYQGSPNRLVLRVNSRINSKISFGINSEKDAGELLKNGFVSTYFQAQNIGKLKHFILGDYQAHFGQGLTFGNGLAFGKSNNITSSLRVQNGFRVSRSFNENLLLRGAAARFSLSKKTEVNLFSSNQKIDARISDQQTFESFIVTGLYRNPNELSNKNSLKASIYGLNINTQIKSSKLGFTAVHSSFNKPPTNSELRPYELLSYNHGKSINMGVDYRTSIKNGIAFGEFSTNHKSGKISSVNGIVLALDKKMNLSALYRHYQENHASLYTNAFGENTRNSNEKGLFLGLELTPQKNHSINAYADYYQFDWLKFQTSAPSNGRDYMVEYLFTKRKKYQYSIRLKQENQQKNQNDNSPISRIVMHKRQSIRFHLESILSDKITLRNRVEQVWYNIENQAPQKGLIIYQDLKCQLNNRINITARYQYFNTSDFNSRIYVFENDLPYTYNVLAFQNSGTRVYLLTKIKLNSYSQIWFKFAQTYYDDKTFIGSGNDQINSNKINQFNIQLTCQL